MALAFAVLAGTATWGFRAGLPLGADVPGLAPRGSDGTAQAATTAGPESLLVILGEEGALASGGASPPARGEVHAATLLAVDDRSVVSVPMPGRLVLPVPEAAAESLAGAAALSPRAACDAVADQLRVRVDEAWMLTPTSLATLVDGAGSVVVDVPGEVVAGGALVPAGPQRLTGAEAAAVAMALGAGEQDRLARFSAVIGGVVAAVDVRSVDGRVAGLLQRARAALGPGGLRDAMLPVQEVAYSAGPAYRVDEEAAARLVGQTLPGLRLPDPADGPIRVLLDVGGSEPGAARAARDRLAAAGLRFAGNASAARTRDAGTVIVVGTHRRVERAERVAAALSLGSDAVRVDPQAATQADVLVVLGTGR